MSRPFLRCYENGCMNFAVDFLYRKHETKKYLRSNFSTAKLKLQGAKQIHLKRQFPVVPDMK